MTLKWEKQDHWVLTEDESPFTIRYIKSGFKNTWIRVHEDPYEGVSMSLHRECNRCEGSGLVPTYEPRGGFEDCPDCSHGCTFPEVNPDGTDK